MTDFTEPPEPAPEPLLPAVPARVRLRRFAVSGLILVAVVALIAAVGRRQASRVGQKQLDAITAKLDAEEPSWRMEDIEADRRTRTPPPDRNAALIVLASADRLHNEWEHQWRGDAQWEWNLPEPHLPKPEHIEQLKAAAPASAEARTIALRLRDYPAGHYPVAFPADAFSLANPHIGKAMMVSTLLEYDAGIAVVADRDPNRAVRAAHAALNLARSVGDEPTTSAQLVRSSCRGRAARIVVQTLAWGEPTEGLAELQAAFLAEAGEPVFRYAMRGDRANMHRLFSGLEAERFAYRDLYTPCGFREPPLAHPHTFRAYRALLPGDHAESLRRLTAGVAAAKLPPHEQLAAAIAQREFVSDDFRYSITNRFVLPIDMMAAQALISRAELETAAVAVACERFRLIHRRWPHDLGEIPTTILAAVPVSPFDGQPLRYQVFDNRIAISCRMEHPTLRGHDPPEFEDLDFHGLTVGARVWHPGLRALPPNPDPIPDPE